LDLTFCGARTGNVVKREGINSDALCSGSEAPRNLVAYFILGLMNNFAYVVFLSAGMDFLYFPSFLSPHPVRAAADILHGTNLPVSVMILVEMIPIIVAQGVAPLFIDKVSHP